MKRYLFAGLRILLRKLTRKNLAESKIKTLEILCLNNGNFVFPYQLARGII